MRKLSRWYASKYSLCVSSQKLASTAFVFTYRFLFINSFACAHFSYWFVAMTIVLSPPFRICRVCVKSSILSFLSHSIWWNEFSWNKVVRGDCKGSQMVRGQEKAGTTDYQKCTESEIFESDSSPASAE